MNRLPRISSISRSQAKTMSDVSFDDEKDPQFPANTLAPPTNFLRRQRDDESRGHSRTGSRASSIVGRRRKSHKKWDDGIGPGGPISQSAIFPNRQDSMSPSATLEDVADPSGSRENTDSTAVDDSPQGSQPEKHSSQEDDTQPEDRESPEQVQVYEEGSHLVFENEEGEVLDAKESPEQPPEKPPAPQRRPTLRRQRSQSDPTAQHDWSLGGIKKRFNDIYAQELEKRKEKEKSDRRHEPARAYQFGNTVSTEVIIPHSQMLTIGRLLSKMRMVKLSRPTNSLARRKKARTATPYLELASSILVWEGLHARTRSLLKQLPKKARLVSQLIPRPVNKSAAGGMSLAAKARDARVLLQAKQARTAMQTIRTFDSLLVEWANV